MRLRDLAAAVSELPPDELRSFAEWFEEHLADAWDRRIEADAAAGRLDALIAEADADIAAGRA